MRWDRRMFLKYKKANLSALSAQFCKPATKLGVELETEADSSDVPTPSFSPEEMVADYLKDTFDFKDVGRSFCKPLRI